MNKYVLYGSIGIIVVIMLIVGYFAYRAFRDRQTTTNIALPDLNEIEAKKLQKKMEAKREKFDFEAKDEVDFSNATTGDEEIDTSKYIQNENTNVDAILGGFDDIIDGKSRVITQNIVKDIELPDLDAKPQSNDGELQSKTVEAPVDTKHQTTTKQAETASEKEFSLPEI